MATRRTSRKTARRRPTAAHAPAANSIYRRRLRYEPLEDRRLLALVTVTTLADSIDFTDGQTSLREAIFATNLVAGPDTIDFAPSLTAGGPGTILLTQGELQVTDSLTIDGPGASLLTIDASGNDPTPEANGDGTRIFNISDNNLSTLLNVAITGLTLTGGDISGEGGAIQSAENLTVREAVIANNTAGPSGGGISVRVRNPGGTAPSPGPAHLTIANSVITGNQARTFGGIDGGGGIFAYMNPGGTVTIQGSQIQFNHAARSAGGIRASVFGGGRLDLIDTEIANNSAVFGHGGLEARASHSSFITISSSTIRQNTSSMGGSNGGGASLIASLSSIIDISQTSVSNNVSASQGGGLRLLAGTLSEIFIRQSTIDHNTAGTGGGADVALVAGGTITIDQSTFSGNNAAYGGGLYFSQDAIGGPAIIRHSTIFGNTAGAGTTLGGGAGGIFAGWAVDLSLEHTTVAGNTASPGFAPDLMIGEFADVQMAHSLVGNNFGSSLIETSPVLPDANGNLIGGPTNGVIVPLLGPLADNGGPTFTHALLPGSPAINAGDLNAVAGVGGVPLYDQRGEPFGRVFNGRIDIGAFEYQAASDLNLLVDTLVDESDGDYSRGDLSLREAVELANMWPSDDTILFDPALLTGGPASIVLTMGELKITDDVSIVGLGAELFTIDASGNDPTPEVNDRRGSRIFNIDNADETSMINVSIASVLLTGGDVGSSGGAILCRESLALDSVKIANNASGVSGGGLTFSDDDTLLQSTLQIRRSTFVDNSSGIFGGGIYAYIRRGTLMLENNLFDSNTATGINSFGGGILADLSDNSATIVENVFRENSAGNGGGVFAYNVSSQMLIDQTQVFLNTARQGSGGGLWFGGDANGVTLRNCIVEGNKALGGGSGGGGVHAGGESVTIIDSRISGNTANTLGGGIHNTSRLTLSGTTVADNLATEAKSSGGGIHSNSAREIVINDCQITGNSATLSGGGLYLLSMTGPTQVTISRSTIADNVAGSDGGGIAALSIDLSLSDCTVSDNQSARDGGGIWLRNGILMISSSTLARNTAQRNGGGAFHRDGVANYVNITLRSNTAASAGGGLYFQSNAEVSHSTIAGNFASSFGGGIFVASGNLQLDHALVALNTASAGPDLTGLLGAILLADYSLISNNTLSGLVEAPVGSPDVRGNIIGGPVHGTIDPKLAPLADNGGPTVTRALLPGSPAINAGDPAAMAGVGGVPSNDQRGAPFTRVYGGRIDMGAFEVQPTDHLLGDFNRDGTVDAGDYVVWRRYAGMTVPAGTGADGNGDGVVNEADCQLWKSQFGMVYAPLPAATVELQDGEATFPTPDEKAERKALRTAIEQASARAIAAALPALPASLARPRSAMLRGRTNMLPTQVETRDDALAAWVASSVPAKVSKEVAASNLELRRAAEVGANDRSKPRALDAVFESLGAAI